MKGINKYKLTITFPQISPTPKSLLTPDLGKSAKNPVVRYKGVVFFQSYIDARGPHELNKPPQRSHPTTTLFAHMQKYGIPISPNRGMTELNIIRAICYGDHASTTK